jgi:hypothetical protein
LASPLEPKATLHEFAGRFSVPLVHGTKPFDWLKTKNATVPDTSLFAVPALIVMVAVLAPPPESGAAQCRRTLVGLAATVWSKVLELVAKLPSPV